MVNVADVMECDVGVVKVASNSLQKRESLQLLRYRSAGYNLARSATVRV